MTIDLYFSNRLEPLAERFADLWADTTGADPLRAPVVVVPNANLAKWLRLFLAEKSGVCMHVDFRYLEDGLWQMLSSLDGGDNPPERLEEDRRVLLLLHLLEHLDGADPDLAPMARYLFEEDGSRRPDGPARLWQLARRLSGLFQEYEYHRSDMIRSWSDPAVPAEGMERCQRRLYRRMRELREAAARRTGERLLSLMEYADEVLAGPVRTGAQGRVHFFGLSQISVFHLHLIGRLQDRWAIHVYALNPSREFWEDARTPRERRWIRRTHVRSLVIRDAEREAGELHAAEDNALLAAWGKPGRESVRLLCEMAGYDFHACFAAPDPDAGVLQRVQSGILSRSSSPGAQRRIHQDHSLQLAACPSRLREVETVYHSILSNLDRDETLQLTDVAVLVPDISAYKPLFETVFHRNPPQITYNLVDSHAEIESLYGGAVSSLLALAAGRFSRSEVFGLLLNPCLTTRWGITTEAVSVWAQWAEALNIFHSFDRPAKRAMGYPDSERFTWKQGLQRLRLSRVLTAPQAVDPGGFAHFAGRVPYEDAATADAVLMERFCTVVEALHRAVEILRAPGAGGRGWARRFLTVCDGLLTVPEDRRGESAVRQALVQAFQRLAFTDDLEPAARAASLSVEWVREFVKANLRAISGGHGDYLTGGVTVSALRPMRPIPFRIVYVLGMEEGGFPGRPESSSLDLRLTRRRIGDILLPEQNAYLFLETLLAARERIYITYVSRDLQKDRTCQPCNVVHQLLRFVEEAVLPDGERFREAEIPLAGSRPPSCAADAGGGWTDLPAGRSLADRVTCFRSRGLWEPFVREASERDMERVARLTPDLSPPTDGRGAPAPLPETITVRQLRRFLENPVREKARRHLGIFDEERSIEEAAAREDEPFYAEFPADQRLKTEAVRMAMERFLAQREPGQFPSGAGRWVQPVYEAFQRRGWTPEGAFADIDRLDLEGQVERHLDTLAPVLDAMQSAGRMLRFVAFGEPGGPPPGSAEASAAVRLPPLPLTVRIPDGSGRPRQRQVLLHGGWPWLWQGPEGDWNALVLRGAAVAPRTPEKAVLEAVLCFLAGLVAGHDGELPGPGGVTLHAVFREQRRTLTYAAQADAARRYLEALAADYLTPSPMEWLPFEPAAPLSFPSRRPEETGVEDGGRERFADDLAEAFAEEADALVRIVRPVVPADALDRARSRFFPFFRWRIS